MSRKTENICFEDLFHYWYRPLCVYALHYLDDVDQAEDTVQECYMSFWERIGGNSSETGVSALENPRSYLYRMVRNRCLDIIRRRKAAMVDNIPLQAVHDENDASDGGMSDSFIADDELQEQSVTEARLWTAIDSLPEKCREIFLMAKRDGMSYEEIALELDISENTVRNQVSKALKTLKEGVKRVIFFLLGL